MNGGGREVRREGVGREGRGEWCRKGSEEGGSGEEVGREGREVNGTGREGQGFQLANMEGYT